MGDPTDKPHDVLAAEEFVVPAPDPSLRKPEPHDVLAAEEFSMPAPDPRLRQDDPHDILAAEEFALPAPDPRLSIHSQPLALPPDPKDPTGAEPAHDVLAAEEFGVPGTAAPESHPLAEAEAESGRRLARFVLPLGALGLLVGRRIRRRRRAG
jgi:hypothetical protein